ncbi:MAG: two-component regulator propeller domain-containing protein [Terracidiphilus sp.]
MAISPGKSVSQLAHASWKTSDGVYVGSPTAIAQTADGYLWIGTAIGLVRFDGVRFIQWKPPAGQETFDPRVFSLLGARDGSLWIGTGYGLSQWKDGQLTNYPNLSGRIEALLEDEVGSIWLARTQITDGMGPVCRVRNAQLTCYGSQDHVPFPDVLGLAKSDDGNIWLGGYSELCLWKPGESTICFPNRTGRPESFALFRALASGPDGSTWAAINGSDPVVRLQHFAHGQWTTEKFPDIPATNAQITSLFVDRDNGLWIGTNDQGMFRIRDRRVERFGAEDGLSSKSVHGFYQDIEGNVWVVTSLGIDTFRDLRVSSYSTHEGLTADGAMSVLASHSGGVWVLNSYQAIQKLKDGKFSTLLPRPDLPGRNVSTMFEDHAGRLWFGLEDGLYAYVDGKFRAICHSDGTPLGIVFSITEDTRHSIWVRAGQNLDEIVDYAVRAEQTSAQIKTAYVLTATPDGGIALGLVDGELMRFKDGKTQSTGTNETGNRRQIRDLLVDPDGTVWGTTLNELFCLRGSKRENLTIHNGLPCDDIFALVEDDEDAIWLYSRCGLIKIARSELNNWWQHPGDSVHTQVFDEADGVQAGLTSLKPQATRTADGRLWFVNGRILQSIDASHLKINTTPPPIHVEAVVADHQKFPPQDSLRLPALTRDLEVDYTAISFVAPQKVRFRYKLDGQDANWQEPGTRRQAFYNDLTPGKYTFHVIACNSDGIWNNAGASLEFSIEPAWFQRAWFRSLCGVLAALIVFTLYQLRVRQIANAIKIQFDERLAERTRLARELHDTFIQTVQGSKMVADDALDEGADAARMRQALEKLSKWLSQAVDEGRAALHSLRVTTTERNHLSEALRRATEDSQIPSSMAVAFSVVGDAVNMHPLVRDEVYRIAYEAIRNAAFHSKASRLEIDLRYTSDLSIRIKDNGLGIDPSITDHGKAGHFGLQGMRERATRIHSKLTIVSSSNNGTEVTLIVPGKVVYRNARATPLERFKTAIRRLLNGSRFYDS